MKEFQKKFAALALSVMLLCTLFALPRQIKAESHIENIALNAAVTCDVCWNDGNWELSNINDGSKLANWPLPAGETLGWRSSSSASREVEYTVAFELESVSIISKVSLYPRGSAICFPDDYRIDVSSDGSSYITVASKTGDTALTAEGRTLEFEPVSCKYVKLVITKLSEEKDGADNVAEISEVEIYGEPDPDAEYNVAKDASVTCSTNWDDPEGYWRLAYVIDGSKLSGWPLPAGQTLGWRSSKSNDSRDVNYEIIFELDSVKTISSAMLYPRGGGNCFPDDYRIDVSSDGTSYTTVKSVTGDTEIKSEGRRLTFDPVDCKYVKIVITKLSEERDGADNVAVLSEVEIYGKTPANALLNCAKKASVTCENNWDDPEGYWRLKYINDGSKMTDWPLPAGQTLGWRSASSNDTRDVNYEIVFELEDTRYVSQVNLYPRGNGGNCFPDDYSVQVSKDGTDYTTVKTVTGDTEVKQQGRNLVFDEAECKFVKIVITKLSEEKDGNDSVAEISEIEIFGTVESTVEEPVTDEPTTDEPTTDEPTTDEPTTDEPTTDEPTTDEPTTDEPTTDEPTTDEPTTDEPTTDEPATDEPATEAPQTGDITVVFFACIAICVLSVMAVIRKKIRA